MEVKLLNPWLAALGIVCSDEFEGTDADAADAAVEVFLSGNTRNL